MLDLTLRGAAIGAGLLIAILVNLRAPRPTGAFSITACCLTVSGYLLVSAPSSVGLHPLVHEIALLLAKLGPLAITLMVLDLLVKPGPARVAWTLAAAGVAVMAVLAGLIPYAEVFCRSGAIVLYTGLIWLTWHADSDDLVRGRRLFRRAFIGMMCTLGALISAIELADLQVDPSILLLQAIAILALTLLFGAYILAPHSDLWAEDNTVQRAKSQQSARPSGLARQLAMSMQDGIWRREGLSIGALAAELNVPEHRLRQTINKELGFRNFSSFVNSARITAAKEVLADPAQERRTVLEIAYEVGFASLGPFNRAFRAETGQSPTEFRAQVNS